MVAWEYGRFFLRLYEEVQGADSLEEVMERGLAVRPPGHREHEVLQRMLQTEPELLLPTLTVESHRDRRS